MNIKISSILTLKSNILSDSFDFFGFIIYLLFVLLLLYLVYFSTKFIAKTYSKVSATKQIKYLEKCQISIDKAIYLIQIEDEKIYFYADKHNMRVLKKSPCQAQIGSEPVEDLTLKKNQFLEILKAKSKSEDEHKA